MYMQYLFLLLVLLVLVIFGPLVTMGDSLEEFGGRGRRGGRGGPGGRGGRGGRGRHCRGGGRRWWGQRWGYRYRPPMRFVSYNPWNWFSGVCKRGCTSIGNGQWGCQYPGSGPIVCWFGNDCFGCGY